MVFEGIFFFILKNSVLFPLNSFKVVSLEYLHSSLECVHWFHHPTITLFPLTIVFSQRCSVCFTLSPWQQLFLERLDPAFMPITRYYDCLVLSINDSTRKYVAAVWTTLRYWYSRDVQLVSFGDRTVMLLSF